MTTIHDDMVERVARALHDKMVEQDVYGYLGAKIDAAELARAAIEAMQPAILAAEKRGEERERERCAKVAESHFDLRHADKARFAGMSIAAAIRKGSDT